MTAAKKSRKGLKEDTLLSWAEAPLGAAVTTLHMPGAIPSLTHGKSTPVYFELPPKWRQDSCTDRDTQDRVISAAAEKAKDRSVEKNVGY